MDALVQRPGKAPVGHQEIELFDSFCAREQVPVRGQQPMSIDGAIGDGDDDVTIRPCQRPGENIATQHVIVGAFNGAAAREVTEDGSEKPRLVYELARTPIVRGARFQHAECEALERIDVLLAAVKVVVEPQHLGNETWPDAEGRVHAVADDRAARHAQQNLPFFVGEPRARWKQPIGKAANDLSRSAEIGKDDSVTGGGVLDAPDQVLPGGPRRDDQEAVACDERRALRGE